MDLGLSGFVREFRDSFKVLYTGLGCTVWESLGIPRKVRKG